MDEMQFYQSPELIVNVRGPKNPILEFILREERVFNRKLVGFLDARNTGPYAAWAAMHEKALTNRIAFTNEPCHSSLLIGQEVFKDGLSKMLEILHI